MRTQLVFLAILRTHRGAIDSYHLETSDCIEQPETYDIMAALQ